jgi:hypothetical protein
MANARTVAIVILWLILAVVIGLIISVYVDLYDLGL